MHHLRSGKIYKCVSVHNLNSFVRVSFHNLYNFQSVNISENSLNSNCDRSGENCNNIEIMANKLDVNLALKIVPEFNGESARELDRFISCCEIIVESISATEVPNLKS